MRHLTLLFSLLLSLLSACQSKPAHYSIVEGVMLGTNLRIVSDIAPERCGEVFEEVMRIDSAMKAEISIFNPNSLLSQINRGESDSLTEALIYNINLADSVSRLSDGAYDVTVMPLVEAWGFASKDAQQRPNIDSLLEFVGYRGISIEGNKLIKRDSRIQMDFNSIAKGYTVDMVAAQLRKMGSNNYLVDIGGEIACRGVNSHGGAWRIGIESPIDGNMTNGDYLEKRITMPANSPLRGMATSGNYRRFYIDSQGNKIAHTIDPISGTSHPSKLLSATVIARNCALADAYGTMFMSLGDKAIEYAEKIDGIEVYFIFAGEGESYKEYFSEGIEERILKE